MEFKSTIIFGKEEVIKIYQGETLTLDEITNHVKTYVFKSKEELDAFEFGINEGVGWRDFCIPEREFVNSNAIKKLINF